MRLTASDRVTLGHGICETLHKLHCLTALMIFSPCLGVILLHNVSNVVDKIHYATMLLCHLLYLATLVDVNTQTVCLNHQEDLHYWLLHSEC